MEYHISLQHYEFCCRELVSYIDTHYSTTTAAALLAPSTLIEEDNAPSEGGPPDARYVSLIELLLFHCLVPLGSHDEAIAFLRKGRRSRRQTVGPQPRDERIAPEVKEAWINELIDLQAAGYTHAVAAAKQLVSAADSHSAQVMPATSFYAGLSALHDATAYTAAAHAGANSLINQSAAMLLPPANLPEAGYLPVVHRLVDEDSDEYRQNESDRIMAEADIRSTALIPFPTLLPIIPTPFDTSFLWSAYIASLGHRVYALLHSHTPRVANRIRAISHWLWSRRSIWGGLLTLYILLRILWMLLRFFRLADLPGVKLLIQEVRNFVRIAFISGTGQSLFA
jgi:hypothetical protein